MLDAHSDHVLDREPVADVTQILEAQAIASGVHGSAELRQYDPYQART